VTHLLIPENYDLNRFFEAIVQLGEIVNNKKYGNNYDYNKTIHLLNLESFLDNNFLFNELDVLLANAWGSTAGLLDNGMLPGYDANSLLKYSVNDQDQLNLTRRINNHVVELSVNKEADLVVDIKQDGIPVWQRVNRGGSTTITIIQRQ
jgi:hypothetical protein